MRSPEVGRVGCSVSTGSHLSPAVVAEASRGGDFPASQEERGGGLVEHRCQVSVHLFVFSGFKDIFNFLF